MTKQDIRMALTIAGVVLFLGWAIGYGIGLLTRPVSVVPPNPPGEAAETVKSEIEKSARTVTGADGATYPGYADVYVNDYADLLDEDAESRIRQVLIDLYDYAGIEMTVLIIDNMGQYGHQGEIEPFATGLFNAWGIGNASRNDGVLVLVARYDRRMRIEIGAGYDMSWNARMQRVIDTGFLPYFRRDEYQKGIEAGVDETVRELTGSYPGAWDMGTAQRGWSWIARAVDRIGEWVLALVLVPLGGLALWLRRYLRTRPRPCPQCRTVLVRAGEEADDEHLDGGQRLEEFLKSVDYDVWHCPGCGHIDIHRYKSWFSSFGACPQCNYRTLSTTSTVLTAATKSREGRKRVDYDCRHCAYHNSETRTIPRISDSNGGGSGRSSFGGGSSSGGGASGSW
ncbi:TPM domain-containing protein [Ruegeria sp. WL0004]|uniref:TPM domain-containing protein n=1 Tax=Ruegeria marisflavi TaxID=2984152 RepID=A0ABT2WRN2_9RHOB|nr:TPM domain-containing protein [Ruegeria sp. WL0004]MCU9838283.1 TPM domain-containing protein [Ruegeria sp. WL0004]